MPTTRTKIAIARLASLSLRGMRAVAGLPAETEVRRSGVQWALDLREGIDLALYLGQYQPIPDAFRKAVGGSDAAVLDIGANIGAFALPMAKFLGFGGRVVAIEPTDFAFAKLSRNLELNPELSGRVALVQAFLNAGDGADDAQGEVVKSIFASWPVSGPSGTHPKHLGALKSAAGAEVLTLDRLAAREPALRGKRIVAAKIDVDGHEVDVLTGATAVLREHKPILLMEVAPYIQDERPAGLQGLLDTLTSLGYGLFHPVSDAAVPNEAGAVRRIVPDGASLDFIARSAA